MQAVTQRDRLLSFRKFVRWKKRENRCLIGQDYKEWAGHHWVCQRDRGKEEGSGQWWATVRESPVIWGYRECMWSKKRRRAVLLKMNCCRECILFICAAGWGRMREVLSDVSIGRNMDMLLQFVDKSEDMGNVNRTITLGSVKKMKSMQSACTVREISMQRPKRSKKVQVENISLLKGGAQVTHTLLLIEDAIFEYVGPTFFPLTGNRPKSNPEQGARCELWSLVSSDLCSCSTIHLNHLPTT